MPRSRQRETKPPWAHNFSPQKIKVITILKCGLWDPSSSPFFKIMQMTSSLTAVLNALPSWYVYCFLFIRTLEVTTDSHTAAKVNSFVQNRDETGRDCTIRYHPLWLRATRFVKCTTESPLISSTLDETQQSLWFAAKRQGSAPHQLHLFQAVGKPLPLFSTPGPKP